MQINVRLPDLRLTLDPPSIFLSLLVTMLHFPLLALALGVPAYATGFHTQVNTSSPWDLERFSNFIVFGDSYTDENRLNYFVAHSGSAPPPGTYLPEVSGIRDKPRELGIGADMIFAQEP